MLTQPHLFGAEQELLGGNAVVIVAMLWVAPGLVFVALFELSLI